MSNALFCHSLAPNYVVGNAGVESFVVRSRLALTYLMGTCFRESSLSGYFLTNKVKSEFLCEPYE